VNETKQIKDMALWRLTREAVHGGGGHVVEHERRRVVPLIRRSEVLDFLRPAQDAAVVQSRFRVPFALSKTETRRINAFDQRYMARWMQRFIPREGGRDLGCERRVYFCVSFVIVAHPVSCRDESTSKSTKR
jgi:hypothetical protein